MDRVQRSKETHQLITQGNRRVIRLACSQNREEARGRIPG